MKETQLQTMKRILVELKPQRLSVVLSLILAMVSVIFTIYIPISIGKLVDCIVAAGNVDFDGIFRISIQMILFIMIVFVSQWVMNLLNNKITYNLALDIRNKAFENLARMPLSAIDNHMKGDYVSRIVNDIDSFTDGVLMGFTQLFTGVLTILGTIYFMLTISVKISIIVIVATPLSLLLAKLISEKTYKHFRRQAEIRGSQTSLIEETINNHEVVKNFDYENQILDDFEKSNVELSKSGLKAIFYSSTVNPSTRAINNIIYGAVCAFGAILVIQSNITVGAFVSFLSYASTYAKPFNEITGVITEFQNALACAKRVFEIIDAPSEIDDGKTNISEFKGSIEFKNVAFSYNKEKTLITDFNLLVKPGQKIAIVGPTGAGKSTIINLLMRFYDVDEGEILIDGVNIKDIPLSKLRASFGMVLQDTWLKEDSIRNNLKFSDETISDEKMIEVSKEAHVHSFVSKMKKGYSSVLSAGNTALSVGQKQLLCIARVMMKIPPMLILDEATSSIDTRTEQKIQSSFNKMMSGRTTFVVAHRLSTIKNADVILFIKDGKIVEQGNHSFLLQKGGFYAKLYQDQFQDS